MPRSGFVLRQVGFSQSLGQIAANTNFFVVRYKARNRLTVLQKHKRNVLIVSPVNAIGKIARGLGNGDARLFHGIRLSDFMIYRKAARAATSIPQPARDGMRIGNATAIGDPRYIHDPEVCGGLQWFNTTTFVVELDHDRLTF